MYICVCRAITQDDIINKFNEGHDTLNKIKKSTSLGSQCGVCEFDCERILSKLKEEKN